MKSKKKVLLSLVLVLSLIFSLALPYTTEAATIKLNAASKTLNVGGSCTLKLSGTTKTPKWSSDNKKVATVTTKGKVTAKAEGKATISAKLNSKTYKCKITVKDVFSATDAVKKVKYELQDTGKGVVALVTNKNTRAISLSAKLVYYDESGKMLVATSDYNYCLEPSNTCALFFNQPYDSNYKNVPYSDYKLTLSVDKSYNTTYGASKISITANEGADNITAEVTNDSSIKLDTISVAIVYYDSNGEAMGYDYTYAKCSTPGSTDYLTFRYPHDAEYNTLYPSNYTIYVNHAYKY